MSESQILIRKIFGLVLVIFALNFLAMKFFWYYGIWWFDMPMHFLGGAFIALLSLWIYYFSDFSPKEKRGIWFAVFYALLVTIAIGALWEFFELGLDKWITFNSRNILDSLSDMAYDISGAMAAALYFLRLNRI